MVNMIETYKTLLNKSYHTLKNEGVKSFITKVKNYKRNKKYYNENIMIEKYDNESKSNSLKQYKDILFINGCTLEHPTRYRVHHQIEQLHFNGYSCDWVFYEDLNLDMVKYYRGFVFFRCPYTDLIGKFIERCNYFNKVTFFDIDDLVIDYKYVKEIKYLKTMSKSEYDLYMDGVNRMQKTLKLCRHAITTTEALKRELENYIRGEVFINRNVSSDIMAHLSNEALRKKEARKEDKNNKVVIGYFSGSITHNDDFNMVLPVIKRILSEYKNVSLKIVGILDVPKELENFKGQIIVGQFCDWTKLPEEIASVDINICPLEDTLFNRAKSENKWVEAAFVKVPTIASDVGAFRECIQDGQTGLLCKDNNDWYFNLKTLIENKNKRVNIGECAYNVVSKHNVSTYTGMDLLNFIESKLNENILFVLPTTNISGGVNVVIKHCDIMRRNGFDVTILNNGYDDKNIVSKDGEVNVVDTHNTAFHAYFHKLVATLWATLEFVNLYPKVKNKYYLVQNFETDFYEHGQIFKMYANVTYNSFYNLNYLTISKWCKTWLMEKFNKESRFAPNGIDLSLFKYRKRDFNEKKIRILIEGNSDDYYKNVDESFKITNKLDRDKFEIWYLSYKGKPKDWYVLDKFIHEVPHEKVSEIYGECHILVKSSILESFSYPPLEMMATGGIAIVAPNEGNKEYLVNRTNCMLYKRGNIDEAINLIYEVVSDEKLREKLISNGLKTAKNRDWSRIENEILALYK